VVVADNAVLDSSETTVDEIPCCTVCQTQLSNVYFKCLNCASVEICEDCERKELHNEQHLLVKLRCPISALPSKQQLVFERHIEDNTSQHKDRRPKKRVIKQLRRAIIEDTVVTKPVLLAGAVLEADDEKNLTQLIDEFQIVKTVDEKLDDLPVEPNPSESMVVVEDPPVGTPYDSIVVVEETPVEQPKVEEQPLEMACVDEEKETAGEAEKPKEEVLVPSEEPKKDEKPHLFKQNLNRLVDMGFTDHDRNVRLLVKHVGDLEATVEELLHSKSWLPVFGS